MGPSPSQSTMCSATQSVFAPEGAGGGFAAELAPVGDEFDPGGLVSGGTETALGVGLGLQAPRRPHSSKREKTRFMAVHPTSALSFWLAWRTFA